MPECISTSQIKRLSNIKCIFIVLLLVLTLLTANFTASVSAQEIEYVATLEATTPEASAYFGDSVACSGDLVVVGEHYADVLQESEEGRAYIYGYPQPSKAVGGEIIPISSWASITVLMVSALVTVAIWFNLPRRKLFQN